MIDDSIQGKWLGRMIDIRGFEGNIVISLQQNKKDGDITGSCVATIGTNHASSEFRGDIKGSLTKEGLQLSASVGEKESVLIVLNGKPAKLKEGGLGLKGTYAISGRGFSPLRGGVICATLNRPIKSVAMATEAVAKPTTTPSNSTNTKKEGGDHES